MFTTILRKEKELDFLTTRFVSITLKPTRKNFVCTYAKDRSFKRKAFLVVLDSVLGITREAVVPITAQSLLSWQHIAGVQPTITMDEQVECEEVVKNDLAFRDAFLIYSLPLGPFHEVFPVEAF